MRMADFWEGCSPTWQIAKTAKASTEPVTGLAGDCYTVGLSRSGVEAGLFSVDLCRGSRGATPTRLDRAFSSSGWPGVVSTAMAHREVIPTLEAHANRAIPTV